MNKKRSIFLSIHSLRPSQAPSDVAIVLRLWRGKEEEEAVRRDCDEMVFETSLVVQTNTEDTVPVHAVKRKVDM